MVKSIFLDMSTVNDNVPAVIRRQNAFFFLGTVDEEVFCSANVVSGMRRGKVEQLCGKFIVPGVPVR